ncbi:MAG: hypothetical protein JST64_07505 [Actinobacteria bacterium]|nr:hypothetical protein [Actinomycetota bacterium]
METLLDPITDVQDRVVDGLKSTKQPVVDAVATVAQLVLDRVPELPALPYAGLLPTPLELIDNQAKFATKVVNTTKAIAVAAAKAAAPVTDQLLDRTAAPVSAVKAA